MKVPKPADMGALEWENYIIAQLALAALGLIPRHAVAMGVEPLKDEIVIHYQLTHVDARDQEDMDDISEELSDLVGDVADIRTVHELRPRPFITPFDGIAWIYRARTDDSNQSVEG